MSHRSNTDGTQIKTKGKRPWFSLSVFHLCLICGSIVLLCVSVPLWFILLVFSEQRLQDVHLQPFIIALCAEAFDLRLIDAARDFDETLEHRLAVGQMLCLIG